MSEQGKWTKGKLTVDTRRHIWGFVGFEINAEENRRIAVVGLNYVSTDLTMKQTVDHPENAEQRANSERLVLCWNSRDALVEALRDAGTAILTLRDERMDKRRRESYAGAYLAQIEAALEAAREKP